MSQAMANPQLAMLMNALQQQATPNPPLATDPTVEARGRGGAGGFRGRSDTAPSMTVRSAGEGRGAGITQMAQEALPNGRSDEGTYDTGNTDYFQKEEAQNQGAGWLPGAGTVHNDLSKGPWTVQEERGNGPNASEETATFESGKGPVIQEQGSPAQQLAQQNTFATAQANHPAQAPRYNADRDMKMYDAIGKDIQATHKQIADFQSKAAAFGNTAEVPQELSDHLKYLTDTYKTLGDRLIGSQGYDESGTQNTPAPATQGPAAATTQPSQTTPIPYTPGTAVQVGQLLSHNGQTGRVTKVDEQGNPTAWVPVQ